MSTNIQQDTLNSDDSSPEWWPPVWALFDEYEQTPPRVLVAEPRPELRLQIGHALRQAGMDADFAESIDEARALSQHQHYDVAVLNPDMDTDTAESLCRALSRGKGRGPIPVITLSDRDSPIRQIKSLIFGAQACLVRPLSSDRFIGTVWRMARRS